MLVTLKPVNREEYPLSLSGPPVFSSAVFGGFESAEVPCEFDDEQREWMLGGRLRIHGENGVAWQGIVTKRPTAVEPLLARGWGLCATFGRRDVCYLDRSYTAFRERSNTGRNGDVKVNVSASGISMTATGSFVSGGNGAWRSIGTTTASRITFYYAVNGVYGDLRIYSGTTDDDYAEPGSWTQEWTSSGLSASGSVTLDIAGSHNALLFQFVAITTSSTGSVSLGKFRDLGIYGTSLTSITTQNVIDDILTNEISTTYLASGSGYRAWVEADTTSLAPLTFKSCEAEEKFKELDKYSAYDYGWYMESVGDSQYCVPHWTARSTTPYYVLDATRADAYDLDESTLEEVVSACRVNYTTPAGITVYKDVTDTSTANPLVALGITRYGDVDAQTTSSATASAVATKYLQYYGRTQTKGSIVTRELRSSTGADVYLPSIRPGRTVRVFGLPQGKVDATIQRVKCTGDSVVELQLDNDPYRLDIALARLGRKK